MYQATLYPSLSSPLFSKQKLTVRWQWDIGLGTQFSSRIGSVKGKCMEHNKLFSLISICKMRKKERERKKEKEREKQLKSRRSRLTWLAECVQCAITSATALLPLSDIRQAYTRIIYKLCQLREIASLMRLGFFVYLFALYNLVASRNYYYSYM